MFETEEELSELQALIDRSFEGMGSHMAGIVKPERRLSGEQVALYLQNVKHVSLATVNSRSEPINAPLDGWFLHGRFVVSTSVDAVRARHMRKRPAVSLTHVDGDEIGMWVHGEARFLDREDPLPRDYDAAAMAVYGSSPYSWGENIVVIEIQPRQMFAYAMDPTKF